MLFVLLMMLVLYLIKVCMMTDVMNLVGWNISLKLAPYYDYVAYARRQKSLCMLYWLQLTPCMMMMMMT